MRSRSEIERRVGQETDAFVIQALRWVLENICPLCEHKKRLDYEIRLRKQEIGPEYLETKFGWTEGIVMAHMENHIEYDPDAAAHVEELRSQSIDTLDSASQLFQRMVVWLDELEELKDTTGLTSQWIADVTKLMGQANASLKLIGQLKKEIGVDSQLLLANAHMNDMSRLLVEVLASHPELLDQVELKMSALRAPVVDVDYTVVQDG